MPHVKVMEKRQFQKRICKLSQKTLEFRTFTITICIVKNVRFWFYWTWTGHGPDMDRIWTEHGLDMDIFFLTLVNNEQDIT